ncbi:MerR family transcriptional regulator [Gemmatimonadota bacterium]
MNNAPHNTRLYTTQEAWKLAGVGFRQAQEYANRNIVLPIHPSKVQGGRRYFSATDIVELAAAADLRRSGLSRDDLEVLFEELRRPGHVFRSFQIDERAPLDSKSLMCNPFPADDAIIDALIIADAAIESPSSDSEWLDYWKGIHQLLYIGNDKPRRESGCLILHRIVERFVFSKEPQFIQWLAMETCSVTHAKNHSVSDDSVTTLRIFDIARVKERVATSLIQYQAEAESMKP